MGWIIPDLPSLQPIKRPSYLLWGIACVLMMVMGFLLTLFLYQDNDTLLFWLFAILVPFTLWLMMFSIRCLYYFNIQATNNDIRQYQQYITKEWQAWSKVQIPIFGHAIICAEPDGLQALTADSIKIPLYPEKVRPLFNRTESVKPYWFLDEVMINLEKQSANYRKYLAHIYLPHELMDDDDLIDAIFQRWDLNAEPINDYVVFMEHMYENSEEVELSLLLVCQYDDTAYHNHSKFISAMLFGCEELIGKTDLQAKAWLGRLMLSKAADLSADIEQLFSYNQLSPQKVKDIWISGLNDKTRLALTMTSYALDLGVQRRVTFHDIDLTFAKPSKLTRYFVLTMVSSSIDKFFREQLSVSEFQGQIYVQLISPKKLM